MRHLVFFLLTVVALSTQVACGNKGPLYLPTTDGAEAPVPDDTK